MQSQAPTTSTTGSVLSLITTSPRDAATVHSTIIHAGFVGNAKGLVMAARDTGAVLAVFDYASCVSTDNTTSRIDVKLCNGIEHGMGSRLVADLEHLADDLDATICNADGEVLTLEALNAIATSIDAMAAQRIEAASATAVPAVRVKTSKRTKPVVIKITKPHGLSFRTRHTDVRGNILAENAFDVPPENYERGWDTGRRAAAEFLAVLKVKPGNGEQPYGLRLRDLLPDVGKAMAEFEKGNRPDREGAALGFLSVLDAAIKYAVHNADMQGYVQRELDSSEAWRLKDAEREAANQVELVERVQAARKAKRAAKATA